MSFIMFIIHTVLMMGTLALTYEYYGQLHHDIPEMLRYFIYAGVAGVSIVWAVGHALGGSILGMAAGGVWDGVKLGSMLGLAMSFSRLWPYFLAFSVGAFLCEAPNWHTIGAILLTIIAFGLNLAVKYIWSHSGF